MILPAGFGTRSPSNSSAKVSKRKRDPLGRYNAGLYGYNLTLQLLQYRTAGKENRRMTVLKIIILIKPCDTACIDKRHLDFSAYVAISLPRKNTVEKIVCNKRFAAGRSECWFLGLATGSCTSFVQFNTVFIPVSALSNYLIASRTPTTRCLHFSLLRRANACCLALGEGSTDCNTLRIRQPNRYHIQRRIIPTTTLTAVRLSKAGKDMKAFLISTYCTAWPLVCSHWCVSFIWWSTHASF